MLNVIIHIKVKKWTQFTALCGQDKWGHFFYCSNILPLKGSLSPSLSKKIIKIQGYNKEAEN